MWLSADRYAADLARARALLGGGRLAGPSSAFWPLLGELRAFNGPVLERAGRSLDVVSWHYYPQQSHRCPVATRRARAGPLSLPPLSIAFAILPDAAAPACAVTRGSFARAAPPAGTAPAR